ncbi:MAG: ATP-binding protein [Muribaculaceae bacterium]|nr:ATP-binding protein [Muribaculaceae bacterium]
MADSANKFILRDYHSVENAEINLNGITVLAGINGCGKSTLSRWLYGFIHYSNEYDKIIDYKTAKEIYAHTNQLVDIQRRLAFLTKQSQLPRPIYFTGNVNTEANRLREKMNEVVLSVSYQTNEEDKKKSIDFLCNNLGLSLLNQSSDEERLQEIILKEEDFLLGLIHDSEERKQQSSIDDLYSIMEEGLGSESKAPQKMQFSENGTDLLDFDFVVKEWKHLIDGDGNFLVDSDGKHIVVDGITGRFMAPMGLRRAIYIDSPMAISNNDYTASHIWHRLKEMLTTPIKPLAEKARPIITEIRMILGGDIIVKDETISAKELRYVRKKDGLNISIDEVATGMKSFAYILRLLQNGYIDSETLLIIDEPEAHLHPQWVVKFAKILVLIHKYLGTKIMIASHNPDMVAAINTIASVEGLDDATNFYQAYKEPGSLKFSYKGFGNDVSTVFDCFNIALEHIDAYKPSSGF